MEEIGYYMKVPDVDDKLLFVKIRGSRCRASTKFLDRNAHVTVRTCDPKYSFQFPHIYRMRVRQTEEYGTVDVIDNIKEFYDYSMIAYQRKIRKEMITSNAQVKAGRVARIDSILNYGVLMQKKLSQQSLSGSDMAKISEEVKNRIKNERKYRNNEKRGLRDQINEITSCIRKMNELYYAHNSI